MRRIAGCPYPVSVALVKSKPRSLRDPNGYYAALGLVDANGVAWSSVTQDDIKRAYRVKLGELHPDHRLLDEEAWEGVELARDCLANSTCRVVYDQLPYPAVWIDRRVLREMADKLRRHGLSVKDLSGDACQKADTSQESGFPYAYYHDADIRSEDLPHPEMVNAWLRFFAQAFRSRGWDVPVRVGFTSGDWRYEKAQWGNIIVVPLRETPSQSKAEVIVRQVEAGHCGAIHRREPALVASP
jgi:hypothetical protein